jgi:hypothetical protein
MAQPVQLAGIGARKNTLPWTVADSIPETTIPAPN